jgi:hypothetical protein
MASGKHQPCVNRSHELGRHLKKTQLTSPVASH